MFRFVCEYRFQTGNCNYPGFIWNFMQVQEYARAHLAHDSILISSNGIILPIPIPNAPPKGPKGKTSMCVVNPKTSTLEVQEYRPKNWGDRKLMY